MRPSVSAHRSSSPLSVPLYVVRLLTIGWSQIIPLTAGFRQLRSVNSPSFFRITTESDESTVHLNWVTTTHVLGLHDTPLRTISCTNPDLTETLLAKRRSFNRPRSLPPGQMNTSASEPPRNPPPPSYSSQAFKSILPAPMRDHTYEVLPRLETMVPKIAQEVTKKMAEECVKGTKEELNTIYSKL